MNKKTLALALGALLYALGFPSRPSNRRKSGE